MATTFDFGNGVTCIDTRYFVRGHAASYLIVRDGEAAFVDTGTSKATPLLLAALKSLGIAPEQVKYILPTHIHLDHGGGVGSLIQQCPNATAIVHPRGVRHLIAPAQLQDSVLRVYGEDVFHNYLGAIVPVDEHRITAAADGMTISLGRSTLTLLDTPGHAYHHYCVLDTQSDGVFTGDTFGMRFPAFTTAHGDFFFLPTTPIHFDPNAWHASIDRLAALPVTTAYPTHFGRVRGYAAYKDDLHQWLDRYVAIAEAAAQNCEKDTIVQTLKQHIADDFFSQLKQHGVTLGKKTILRWIGGDIDLNAQGLAIWLTRRDARV